MSLLRFVTTATLLSGVLSAQRDAGIIRGTVTDATGAVVADAQLTITNEETGVLAFTASSDESGRYVAPALKAGGYVIGAEAKGFKKSIRRGIVLEVSQTAVVHVTLDVGQVTETVEVTEQECRGCTQQSEAPG
jgi:hypothetical protein